MNMVGTHWLVCNLVLLDKGKCRLGIEALHDDNRSTHAHCPHAETERRCVIKRRRRQINRIGIQVENVTHLHIHRREFPKRIIYVGLHHPFRPARRPRGIKHIFALDIFRNGGRGIGRHCFLIGSITHYDAPNGETMLDFRHLVQKARGNIRYVRGSNENPSFTIIDDIFDFLCIEVCTNCRVNETCHLCGGALKYPPSSAHYFP